MCCYAYCHPYTQEKRLSYSQRVNAWMSLEHTKYVAKGKLALAVIVKQGQQQAIDSCRTPGVINRYDLTNVQARKRGMPEAIQRNNLRL